MENFVLLVIVLIIYFLLNSKNQTQYNIKDLLIMIAAVIIVFVAIIMPLLGLIIFFYTHNYPYVIAIFLGFCIYLISLIIIFLVISTILQQLAQVFPSIQIWLNANNKSYLTYVNFKKAYEFILIILMLITGLCTLILAIISYFCFERGQARANFNRQFQELEKMAKQKQYTNVLQILKEPIYIGFFYYPNYYNGGYILTKLQRMKLYDLEIECLTALKRDKLALITMAHMIRDVYKEIPPERTESWFSLYSGVQDLHLWDFYWFNDMDPQSGSILFPEIFALLKFTVDHGYKKPAGYYEYLSNPELYPDSLSSRSPEY